LVWISANPQQLSVLKKLLKLSVVLLKHIIKHCFDGVKLFQSL